MSIKQNQDKQERGQWLSVLAQAPPKQLDQLWQGIESKPAYSLLRKPEVGLILVQGRAGNTGKRFYFGEMTVTRCAIRTEEGLTGFGYLAGRRIEDARKVAVLDAMLQDENLKPTLIKEIIEPLAQSIENLRQDTASQAGATKVNFFTMPRKRSKK